MSNRTDKNGPPIPSVPEKPADSAVQGPPGMGDLNYLQSLLLSQNTQELYPASSPTFAGITLSGLTASLPIVTNASKALASVSYATFKASLAIAQADVSGLTTGASPTFAGLTLTAFSGFVKATAGVLSAAALTDADIPNDITLTNITQITNRSHTSLSDIGTLTHATIDGYLDQAVKAASSPAFAALTSPLVLGGVANNSTLTLKATSHGTAVSGSDIIFQVGNNGAIEAGRFLYNGYFGLGIAAPGYTLHVVGQTYITKSATDADLTTSQTWNEQIITADTTKYGIANTMRLTTKITGGKTNSGYHIGNDVYALRSDQGGSVDTGTIALIIGQRIQGGHFGTESKTTTALYGLYLGVYHNGGTIGTYTGLALLDAGGAGTVTTKYHIYADGWGKMYRGGGTTWDTTSDQRLKRDIRDYQGGMDLIRQLQVKAFKYNGLGGIKDDGIERVGLVADDLAAVFPEATYLAKHTTRTDPATVQRLAKEGRAITLDPDDGVEYLGYSFDRILFTMLNALKETDARLEKLEGKK